MASPTLNALFQSLSIVASGKIASFGLGLFITTILATLLTRPDFAILMSVFAMAQLAAPLLTAGLVSTAPRLAADAKANPNPHNVSHVLSISLWITIVAAFVSGGTVLLIAAPFWFDTELSIPLFLLLLLYLIMYALNRTIGEWLRGLGAIGWATLATSARPYGGLAAQAMLAAVLSGLALSQATLSITSSAAIIFVALLAGTLPFRQVAASIVGPGAGRAENIWRIGAPILRGSSPVMLGEFLQLVGSIQLAATIASVALPASGAANFLLAVNYLILVQAPLSIINLASPHLVISRHQALDMRGAEEILRNSASIALMISLPTFGVILAFGDTLITMLLGSGYGHAGELLAILGVGVVCNVAFGSMSRALVWFDKGVSYVRVSLLGGFFGAAAILLGAGTGNATGLAIGCVAAVLARNLVGMFHLWQSERILTVAHGNPVRYWEILRQLATNLMHAKARG
ncbi:MAG TPA: lipopolysaccharide biosynthesis protein [Elainellaceae cyanobacterium]